MLLLLLLLLMVVVMCISSPCCRTDDVIQIPHSHFESNQIPHLRASHSNQIKSRMTARDLRVQKLVKISPVYDWVTASLWIRRHGAQVKSEQTKKHPPVKTWYLGAHNAMALQNDSKQFECIVCVCAYIYIYIIYYV
jgi:hypothetical protein